ncbi:MAG: hypothetical protein ABSG93_04580 [Solirubrobacteraceae bacterium]|jgi:hypothetical protein
MSLSNSALVVAWVCFVIGGLVFLAGVVLGLLMSWRETTKGVSAKEAKAKVQDAATKVKALTATAVTTANTEGKDTAAATKAGAEGSAAESALKEIEGIIGALPERLRFAAVLILIGALLMSVATVQFGGHSIF